MLELFLEEFIVQVISLIIGISIISLTIFIRQIRNFIKEYLGIELAEIEAYYVAKRLYDFNKNTSDIIEPMLKEVSKRLKRKGIKIPEDEMLDIIQNTLKEIIEEEEKY